MLEIFKKENETSGTQIRSQIKNSKKYLYNFDSGPKTFRIIRNQKFGNQN